MGAAHRRSKVPRRAVVLAAALLAATGAARCTDPAARQARDRRRTLTEGHRSASRARRTADERPKPWEEEKRPFDDDRTGVDSYRAEKRARDVGHGPGPTLAECLRLTDGYPCPLLVHRWAARDIDHGISISVAASSKQAALLRRFVRCHHRYGRYDKNDQSCLRQFSPLRVTGGYRDGSMWLELVTDQPDQPGRVTRLRQGVRELISEAR